MPSRRMFQVNELLRQEISQIVLTEMNDPRLLLVTITSVHTSADLHHARVYYQFHGGEADRQKAQQGLQHAGGRIRHLLGQRVRNPCWAFWRSAFRPVPPAASNPHRAPPPRSS